MIDRRCLSHAIREYRRLHGLTQSGLAARLFVTTQSVSKWETGKALPDVDKLCELAALLSLPLDRLLGMGNTEQNNMIAIDGGGTKTEFVLFTPTGEVRARLVLGSTNPNAVGMEPALTVMRTGIDRLLRAGMGITAIYAGVAGCGSPENRRAFLSFFKKNYPDTRCEAATDIRNVIHASSCEGGCIAVICGTGSVVYADDGKELHRVGGWGYLFDKGGSGFDYGRDAITAALAEGDGIGEPTVITPRLTQLLGYQPGDALNKLYTLPRDKIASLAPLVFDCAREGDAVAAGIIEKNNERLALLIRHAADTYKCGRTVVLSGGLTARRDDWLPDLRAKLPDLTLLVCDKPQIFGAARRCAKLFSKPEAGFTETFLKTYAERKTAGEEPLC